ncbi:protein ALP1-like [Andrographis paniculata]|uniref:protein ALP1-like n=1 Tax=Andrographis paniculata TaxID=175694 RepID=UPI0021E6FDCD|nr:protein ALP1-like [Andrographis paniculata]
MMVKRRRKDIPQHPDPQDRGGGLNQIVSSLALLEKQEEEEATQKHKRKPKDDEDEDEDEDEDNRASRDEIHRGLPHQLLPIQGNPDTMDYYSNPRDFHRRGNKSAKTEDSPSDKTAPQRRLWVKNRSKDWWDQCNSPDFPEEEFKKAFRMGKATFDFICSELSSVVAKENTMLRDAVPVRQRVAVCIWRLATGEPLRLVSKKFGLGISTCHKLVLEVCSAIRNVLMPKYLRWPNEDGLARIQEEFESMSAIPSVIGSMYTTHIPIIAPKNSVAAYFNRRHTERNQKTSYSITIQGVVDPKGVFTDVCIGYPGSMPDDQVLEKSTLFQRAGTGFYKGVWIVGGAGYPLMDWVLVPYTHQHLTWTQHAFNEKIGEIQRLAKGSFGRLKTRWGCLQKRTEVKLQDLPVVLGACCVLHNICEMRNEDLDSVPEFELVDDEMVPEIGLRSANAMKARDTIAHNLLHHNHAGTSFLS